MWNLFLWVSAIIMIIGGMIIVGGCVGMIVDYMLNDNVNKSRH